MKKRHPTGFGCRFSLRANRFCDFLEIAANSALKQNYFADFFLAGLFLATAFFAGAFFAGVFFAAAFFGAAFLAGAFFAADFFLAAKVFSLSVAFNSAR